MKDIAKVAGFTGGLIYHLHCRFTDNKNQRSLYIRESVRHFLNGVETKAFVEEEKL